jgi:hypothetical protein
VLVAGTGQRIIDAHAQLPGAAVSIPTGISATKDGALLVLVNGDGGTLIHLALDGQAEPYRYYLRKSRTGGTDIDFDSSHSRAQGWAGQQDSSSMISRSNGDLWIYANRWIATITSNGRAIVLGRLGLPETKARNGSDLDIRLFRGPGEEVLLIDDGKIYQIKPDLSLTAERLPKGISSPTAAAGQGDDLLLGGSQVVYRIRGGRIAAKDNLGVGRKDSAGDVVSIAPDDRGGYFAATSAGLVFRVKTGSKPMIIAGMAHKAVSKWGGTEDCPPVGHMHLVANPLAAALGYPESMLLRGNQLYIADAACSRLYAIGVAG